MNEIFELIVKSTIYGSITGILILFIKFILKENLTPKWSYFLWLLLIIKLIIPVGPESNISIFNKIESYKFDTSSNLLNNKINESFTQLPNDKHFNQSISNNYLSSVSKTENTKSSKNYSKYFIITTIKSIWILASISIFTFSVISYIMLNTKLNKVFINPNKKLISILNDSKKRLNISKNIKIIVNEYISTPALIGVFSPKILLPLNMTNLENHKLRHVFLHELSHYKRKDNFMNIVLLIIQSIHWFNPFIWYLIKKLKEDMELATDEKVLNILSKDEYISYGQTLLDIISRTKKYSFKPTLIMMAKNKKDMEKRIMNIKFLKKSKEKKIIFTFIGVLALGVTSPVVLTNALSNTKASLSNTKTSQSLNNYKLTPLQSKYFDLIEFMNEDKDILVDKMRNKITEFNLEKTEQQGENNRCDIYTIGDEKLEVYYVKRDGQGPYYLTAITYTLNGNDLSALQLYYSNDVNEISTLQIATESSDELANLYNILNLKKSLGNLYSTYIKLVNKVEEDNLLNKDDLLKINPNFKLNEPDTIENEISYTLENKEKNKSINVIFDKDSGKLESIYLSSRIPKSRNGEYLFTKTKYFNYKDWDVQDHYNQLYNLKADETNHLVSIFSDSYSELKSNFIDIMNKYNQ